jgi:hypothetical protein
MANENGVNERKQNALSWTNDWKVQSHCISEILWTLRKMIRTLHEDDDEE